MEYEYFQIHFMYVHVPQSNETKNGHSVVCGKCSNTKRPQVGAVIQIIDAMCIL